MPFRIGPWELGILLVIILIVFGVGKLPQIGSAFGKSMREFKQAQQDIEKTPDAESKPAEKHS